MPVIHSERVRTLLHWVIPFLLIPAVVAAGALLVKNGSYALTSVLVCMLSLVLFYTGFERKTVGSRRMVIIAVMTALSVLGRFVFAAIPGFKPITAMVVITAIWLGGESGFLVGSLTALISNFYFGQGPWTPFQMLSFGLIGIFAGFLAKPLKQSRLLLALYGIFAGIFYSCVMDIWTVLWYDEGFQWQLYLAAITTAVPYMISYAASNVIFLLLLGRPFGKKMERVRLKYGV